ncbi:helix-turn-helix domain-containing protein [Sciscionella marina]|uniref:helix-turn-helix domain-containing protein n=1 Tax=Sciscionella marina TaxID=508770 RepID=UPI000364C1D0|nr:helix-turn-helix transcriptional regulator [Sciscionella marina]
MSERESFGVVLRRARERAGMTQGALAGLVGKSVGQISRLESGERNPHFELVRACEAALGCAGELLPAFEASRRADGPPGAWTRRRVLCASAGAALSSLLPLGLPARAGTADEGVLAGLRECFLHARQMGQRGDANMALALLPGVCAGAQQQALGTGDEAARRSALRLGARSAEYAAWMQQEAGDAGMAERWITLAEQMAKESGYTELLPNLVLRRALIAYYAGWARRTIELTEALVGDQRIDPRVRCRAAQRQAQGYALAFDEVNSRRSVDRARSLAVAEEPDAMALGSIHVPDQVSMTEGWCATELGEHEKAICVLDKEIDRLAPDARRARARFGIRAVLSCVGAEDLRGAHLRLGRFAEDVQAVGSATVALDVRQCSRILRRYRGAGQAVELAERLERLAS